MFTRRRMVFLASCCMILDGVMFPAIALNPVGFWFGLALAIGLGAFNGLVIAKLEGWID